MDRQEVKTFLQDAFEQWGMPMEIRVDNGYPWGSTGDFPTELSLWILGLKINMHWNTPRRPQENGVVERSQGTGKRWSEPGQCSSAMELQDRIDQMDHLQREQYPRPGGKSRMELFPSLRDSQRHYSKATDREQWEWHRVGEHLADYIACRRVDCSGKISIYDCSRYVGTRLRGMDVYVSLDPLTRRWIVSDRFGTEIRTLNAPELDDDAIRSLNVIPRHRHKYDFQVSGKT